MLAIAVDLLTERYVATAYNDREQVEWPPHPGRLFSALAATWAEGEPTEPEGEVERQALLWLERQEPPDVLACDRSLVALRTVAPMFVPVNDTTAISAPDRTKLDAALDARAKDPTSSKLDKEVAKLEKKLLDDTKKATAVPARFGKHSSWAEGIVIGDRRNKQPRTFPSATPAEPIVLFVWPSAELPSELAPALDRLLRRLVRLGHSSSLVRASVVDEGAVAATRGRTTRYVPDDERGDVMLRWVAPGQLERLAQAFERHRETEPRVLPARFTRYAQEHDRPTQAAPGTVFEDEFVVFARVGGPRLPITAVAGISKQLRNALMSVSEQPVSELLSGHRADGGPSEVPHAAIVPLPFVGHHRADGAVIGIGVILPHHSDPEQRRKLFKAIGHLESSSGETAPDEVPPVKLLLGRAGVLELERASWGENRQTLTARHWCRPSRYWASATPVALDRNPGNLHDPDPDRRAAAFAAAEGMIRSAVARLFSGLTLEAPQSSTTQQSPELVEVDVVRSCVLPGSAKPRNYPRFPADTRRPQRVLVHVRLAFAAPVRGPILLGAGRYQGLGLCLPVGERGREP